MHADEPHPQLQAVLDEMAEAPEFNEMSLEEARGVSEEGFATDDPIEVGEIRTETIDGPGGDLDLRLYLPEGGHSAGAVFFHGGGFVTGSLDSHDPFCRALTAESGVGIVSVDYRLAPEHEFPAAVEDAYAATEWVAENAADLGFERVAVAGDSAGGNLAAVVAQMARDRNGPELAYQLLAYPTVSYDREWPSLEEFGEGYFVSADDVRWFKEQYFGDDIDPMNVYASPVLREDLSDLPPATVTTNGFDPLRDEGVAYAERLEAAGVEVTHHHYDDAIHAHLQMATSPLELDPAVEALEDIAADLSEALADD